MKTLFKLLLLSMVCEAFMCPPAAAEKSNRSDGSYRTGGSNRSGSSGQSRGSSSSFRAPVTQRQVQRAQPSRQITSRQQVARPAIRQSIAPPSRQMTNRVSQPQRDYQSPRVIVRQDQFTAPARKTQLPQVRPATNQFSRTDQFSRNVTNATRPLNPPARTGIASSTATSSGRSVVLPGNRQRISDTARTVRPSASRIRDSHPPVVRPGQNSIGTRRPDVDRIRSQPQWRGNRDTRVASVSRNFRNGINWSTRCQDWGYSPWWNRSYVRPWYGGCWNGNWNRYYYRDYYCYDPWYRSYLLPGYVHYDSYYPVGWGLLGWSLGSMVYDIGYETYSNPYPASTVVASSRLDVTYTEPLARLAARSTPADEAAVQETTRNSESFVADSQAAFRAQNYLLALELADKAIAESPGDGALHEYRALVLFALGRYGEASGVLHPVIASGPGWDWATMRALYDSLETYTSQIRRLEAHTLDNPTAADARFLLGYHYMVCGHLDSAAVQFESAANLVPADRVSSQLANLARFSVKDSDNSLPPGVRPAPAPAKSLPREIVPLEKLQGTWVATRDSGATITLRFLPDGNFTWTHLKDAKSTELAGAYSINDNGLLVLDSPDTRMVADVSLPAERQLKFVLVGGPPADPGLEFRKP